MDSWRRLLALEEVELEIAYAQPAHREGEVRRGDLLHPEELSVEARRLLEVVGVDADVGEAVRPHAPACLHRPHRHCLPGRVEVYAGGALLASANARLLVPAEGHLELEAGCRNVDVYEAGLRAGYELLGVAQGLCSDAGGQAEAGVVGDLYGVVEVARPDDCQDRPENLLLRRRTGVVHVGDDGRRYVVALLFRAGGSTFADHAPVSVRFVQGLEDALVLIPVHHGPYDNLIVERVADLHSFGGALQFVEEVVVDALNDHGAARGCALLARVAEGTVGYLRRGVRKIGVLHHDVWVFATHLELHLLADGPLLDAQSNRGRACEREGLDPRIGDQRIPDGSARPGDHVDYPVWKARLGEDAHQGCGVEGGVGGRLDDDGVAADQGRRHLPGGYRQGEVPRRNKGYQSYWLAHRGDLDAGACRGRHDAGHPPAFGAVVAEYGSRAADLGPALRHRLAHLARHELRQLVHPGLDDVRGFAEDRPALGGERGLPSLERLRRRFYCPLGLGPAGLGRRTEDLGGVRGVCDLVDLAGVRRHPLAAYEVLGLYLRFDHRCLPPVRSLP